MSITARHRRHLSMALLFGLTIATSLALPHPAHAQTAKAPELSIRPTGQAEASFFDLQVAAGEERALEVEIVNTGSEPVQARTYSADAYTIVNGGFGIELFGQPPEGATTWIDYGTEILDLAPGATVTRSFTLRVPPDARAGEHITGLAVENAEAIAGTGRVALDQVVRKAIAVLVTVPGPVEPGFRIGGAAHLDVDERSVVAVSLSNTGNVRLRPQGDVAVLDATGTEVARKHIRMDSFYAGTGARLELPLDDRLPPGTYTVTAELADTERGVAASGEVPLTVREEPTPAPADADSGIRSRLPAGIAELVDGDDPREAIIAFTVGLVVVALGVLAWRRRRRPVGAHSAARSTPQGNGGNER